EDAIDALGDGHAGLRHRSTSRHLVARDRDRPGRWTDEHDARLLATYGKVRFLREEPVTRMDRVGARLGSGADDRSRVQVALRRERTSDLDAFIHRGPV